MARLLAPPHDDRTTLRELAFLFARLGATAFGGPAAHIAMIHDEVVRRRNWLTDAQFVDLLGATNLIPGPNSTELAIHIGWERRRWSGLFVAGVSFIVPAMLMTSALGYVYLRFGSVPTATWISSGVKPVVLAVVVQAIGGLAPKAAPTTRQRGLAALAALLAGLGVNELAVLLAMGAIAVVASWVARDRARGSDRLHQLAPLVPVAVGTAGATAVTLPGLFGVFLKIGSVLFGSGYVLLAFLRGELVQRLGWLTDAQLVDAVAVGQVTPGPVFTTATFIGYVLGGPLGALAATAGIFLPAFFFVALSAPLLPRLRASPTIRAFLDGANAASLALMCVAVVRLGYAVLTDVPSVCLAVAAAVLLLVFKPNASWLVLGGAAAGWLLHAARLSK